MLDQKDASLELGAQTINLGATRRAFINALGLGAAGAAILGGTGLPAMAAPSDMDIFNFALNFEYLGAEFYLYATTGAGLPSDLTAGGQGGAGAPVAHGRKVPFQSKFIEAYANQLAQDEVGHVKAVRAALGSNAVRQPAISLGPAFRAAAAAAGIADFDVFANDVNFLIGAFVLEDVCVTALRGAAPLINKPSHVDAAAGLLGAEAYQAGMIRVKLYSLASNGMPGIFRQTAAISNLRNTLSNAGRETDQPLQMDGKANIVPARPGDSIVFARTPREVLNIAYGKIDARMGGFFPQGVNGAIQ